MENIKNIKITDFAKRHFDPKFGGTKITDMSVEEFELKLNSELNLYYGIREGRNFLEITSDIKALLPGYADFCKLVCVKNTTSARTGSLPITMANYQYLRSGFSSRTPNELAVMERWFELPIPAPRAEYLMVVLYSKEQVNKERNVEIEKNGPGGWAPDFEGDWGVVAILGQMYAGEEPMKPITMMRNALGIEEGGSGVTIDKQRYAKSVAFWSENATVK